jgi:hypothetical protein
VCQILIDFVRVKNIVRVDLEFAAQAACRLIDPCPSQDLNAAACPVPA